MDNSDRWQARAREIHEQFRADPRLVQAIAALAAEAFQAGQKAGWPIDPQTLRDQAFQHGRAAGVAEALAIVEGFVETPQAGDTGNMWRRTQTLDIAAALRAGRGE